jgi:hypothetical protein
MCSISGLRNVAQNDATTGRDWDGTFNSESLREQASNAQRSTLNVQRPTSNVELQIFLEEWLAVVAAALSSIRKVCTGHGERAF